ncbi:MAG TPA: hypothetical protein VHM65_05905 [Candidatus Lustribacter sp.]|nr:hypothetical protein [Candidatus Lustribacter sp.]
MTIAFALPGVHSGPHDLKLGMAGPASAVAQVTGALAQNAPGAFEPVTYADEAAVRSAITSRKIHGGIVVGQTGPKVLIASAGGTPIATVLRTVAANLGQSTGTTIPVEDVVPYRAQDPNGAGLASVALPLSIGGIIPAVILLQLFTRSLALRLAGAIAFALVAAFFVIAILTFWTHTIGGSYVLTSLVFALGISAITLVALGLESLVGLPGLGLIAILMIFVANPLSGLATAPAWLPSPWGAIGQLMPPGASGTALRSFGFFDGQGAGAQLVTLAAWAVAGLALAALGARRTTAPEPAA